MNLSLPKPITRNLENQIKWRWKTFWFLLTIFVVGAIANIPHSKAVKELSAKTIELENYSTLQSIISNGITALIVGSIFIWIGLWISAKAGLGAPLISEKLSGKPFSKVFDKNIVVISLFSGIILGALILGLLKIQEFILPIGTAKANHPSAIPSLFASFSAGITEEIIFRLGIMSLLITIIQFLVKLKTASNRIIWIGNILTALSFGLVHIPMSHNYFDQTPIVIGTIILGNVITGTTFGWIFWRYGLIMAMLVHFISDVVLHVIGSPFG